MAKPIHFVHITDLHIVHGDHPEPAVRSDTEATLRTVRAQIEAMAPRPSFVAVSGDLTNHGDVESFQLLRSIMEGLPIPVIYGLGNHDSRPGFYAGMGIATNDPTAPYDHDVAIDGLHVITLDTSEPYRIGGTLEDGQFEFLADALDRHPGLPKLIIMHHAPALDFEPDWEWESLSFTATERLAALLPNRGVIGILSGHIHQDRAGLWHGIPLFVGMGQHCAVDPLFAGEGIRSVSGTSISLGTLRDSGLTITYAPHASARTEVGGHTLETLRAYEARLRSKG